MNAGTYASNLSELELTLGDVPGAEATAARSVAFADRVTTRTAHANALHQAGRVEASHTLFDEAEAMQAESQPGYPILYSLRGYQYCDLLLAAAERAAWKRRPGFPPAGSPSVGHDEAGGKMQPELAAETAAHLSNLTDIERRAAQTLEWVTPTGNLLSIALDHLTLGRVYLLRAIFLSPNSHLPSAGTHLDTALATLRESNNNDELPRALLPCAWLHAFLGEWDTARQRLDESFALATRGGNAQNGWQGGMRLHLVDTLLYRARLFGIRRADRGAPTEYPWPGRTPAIDLDEAENLINACGYHRRDAELAAARATRAPEPR